MVAVCRQHLASILLLSFKKNPAYGRQRISQPMRIVGPIQFFKRLHDLSFKKKTRTKTRTKNAYKNVYKKRVQKRVQKNAYKNAYKKRVQKKRVQKNACTHPPFLGLHACNKMDAWPMDGPVLLHARTCLIPSLSQFRSFSTIIYLITNI